MRCFLFAFWGEDDIINYTLTHNTEVYTITMGTTIKEKLTNILGRIEDAAHKEDQTGIVSALNDIPQFFWEDQACYLHIVETFFAHVKFDMSIYPVHFIPDHFWEIPENVEAYILTLCKFYEEASIDFNLGGELIPRRLLNDKKIVTLLLRSNVDETFGSISEDFKADPDIVLAALEGLQNKIEFREYNSSSWLPPHDKRVCLEELINELPDSLFSNKSFILDFLLHNYFRDEFDVLYERIDQNLWSDKDFVFEVLSRDRCAIMYVTDKDLVLEMLAKDEDAIEYVLDELFEDADFVQKVKEELGIEI